MPEISIPQLQAVFDLLISKLKADGLEVISLKEDYYWTVLGKEAYDFDASPEPVVGSLEDDVLELKKTLLEPDRLTYLEFDRIAALLNCISEQQMPGATC
ncbi:MAG: hypothetical protein H7330_15900 [Hymenobacteraceae bacterium]|nr:hypothetical protein [Hymenobacteraceae bacterium]